LCKIVHKLTENARFFAQKPHFLHIFAGGRDDFLAGPKSGFLGGLGVARAAPPKTRFRTVCESKNRPVALTQHSYRIQKKYLYFFISAVYYAEHVVYFRQGTSSKAPVATQWRETLPTFGASRKDGVLL
jgi:hypothetical protein